MDALLVRPRSAFAFRSALALFAACAAASAAHAQIARGATHVAAARRPLPEWRVVGSGPVSSGTVLCPQILVSPAGVPTIAYQDFNATFHRLSAKRFANGAWQSFGPTGTGSLGDAWYNRMAFDAQGALVVACRDYGLFGGLGVRRCGTPGSTWQLVGGAAASAGEAHYTDIVLLGDGSPIVAYQDRTTTPPDRTSVARLGANGWEQLGPPGISASSSSYQSIALAPDGTLLCAFTDYAYGGRAVALRWDETAQEWQSVGAPGFTPDIPNNLVLRIAPDGTPHVAYYVWNQRVIVRRFDGTGWPQLGASVTGADQPTVETEGWRQWLSLDFDRLGRPWVAYQAQNLGRKAVVKRWNADAATWDTVGAPAFTPAAADYLSMDLGPDDTPYVVFRDGATQRALVMAWH